MKISGRMGLPIVKLDVLESRGPGIGKQLAGGSKRS